MKSEPVFSILMVTYNRAHLLPRAVKSVLNQTYRNFELIIVDDGSTDNTEDVCRAFGDHRVRYYKQSPNKGVQAARNKTLDMATGDYLAILDDDDTLIPEALETAVREFERLSAQDVKVIWFNSWDSERQQRSGWGSAYGDTEAYVLYEDLLCSRIGGDYWQAIARDIVDEADRFDERLWCGEIVWALKVFRKGKGYYVPKMLQTRYREHGHERVSSLETMLNHLPELILTNKALIAEYGEDQRNLCPKAYGRRLGVLGVYQIMNGEKTEGRKACFESFKYGKWAAFMAVFALSFILSGRQIRGMARTGIKVLDRFGAVGWLPTR